MLTPQLLHFLTPIYRKSGLVHPRYNPPLQSQHSDSHYTRPNLNLNHGNSVRSPHRYARECDCDCSDIIPLELQLWT